MKFMIEIPKMLDKWAKEQTTLVKKSTQGALYDAAFLLYKEAKQALSKGQLGLPERVALSNLRQARKETRGRAKASLGQYASLALADAVKLKGGAQALIPLKGLTPGILYKVFKEENRAEVGFIGMEGGAARIAAWAEEMAGKHLPGYTILYDKDLRDKLHKIGIHLKKSTTQSRVVPRSIIGRTQDKFAGIALEKLQDSFDRKMAGERT